jgi:hypothetical protein
VSTDRPEYAALETFEKELKRLVNSFSNHLREAARPAHLPRQYEEKAYRINAATHDLRAIRGAVERLGAFSESVSLLMEWADSELKWCEESLEDIEGHFGGGW